MTAHRLLEVLPGAPSHARRFDSPMVGRSRELALFADAFERCVAERSCHLFTVLGAAGVGKSRLVAEGLRALGDRAEVLRGACLPYGEGITFWPALEVVKQAAGITDGDSTLAAAAKIERVFAGEAGAAGIAESVASLVGVGEARFAGEEFWAFRKLLEALARRRALVVVFDDANWGETTFLDLVEHVAEWTRDAPILLVCLARPDLLDARPAWGGGKRNATSIFLEPLSHTESELLLAHLVGKAVVGGEVAERIHRSAEGNPLFVEEMVSMLIDGGFLRADGTAAADLADVPVPASIQVLLASRLDQLDAGERRVLERAAVEGTIFHRGAVEALADEELRGRVDSCLAALVRKELVRQHGDSFAGEDAFRFRHVLIRDAAYDALPKQVRAELHERFAVWLEDVAGERVGELDELVGYHLEQAHRYRLELVRLDDHARALALQAGSRLAAAGRRAAARGDMPAAVNLLERAAPLLDEPHARLRVVAELGAALREAGQLADADRVLSEALEAATAVGDDAARLRITIERAHARLMIRPDAPEAAYRDIDAAMASVDELDDDQALAVGWAAVGLCRGVWAGRFADGERALERALVHARRCGDRRQEVQILRNLALAAAWGPRNVSDALRRCEDILEQAADDPLIEANTLRFVAVLEARRGDFERARSMVARVREIHDDLGLSENLAPGFVALALGEIELLAGNYAEAEQALLAGLEVLDRLGEQGHRASGAAWLAQALYAQGRLDEAEAIAAQAQETAAPDDVWTQPAARGTRAKVRARRGQAGAEVLAREAVELIEQTDGFDLRGTVQLDLAEVAELEGRLTEAREAGETALAVFEREENAVASQRARQLLRRLDRRATEAADRAAPAS